jgi:hypothetical protein
MLAIDMVAAHPSIIVALAREMGMEMPEMTRMATASSREYLRDLQMTKLHYWVHMNSPAEHYCPLNALAKRAYKELRGFQRRLVSLGSIRFPPDPFNRGRSDVHYEFKMRHAVVELVEELVMQMVYTELEHKHWTIALELFDGGYVFGPSNTQELSAAVRAASRNVNSSVCFLPRFKCMQSDRVPISRTSEL